MLKYNGQLCWKDYGDDGDVLFLSSHEYPFTDVLQDEIAGKTVSVRYWWADTELEPDKLKEAFTRRLVGDAFVRYDARYSELTGSLWTDEDLEIGGHDLLTELQDKVGKWLYMEIDIHEGAN